MDELHKKVEGSSFVQRHLLLRFIETAAQCLKRMQGVVFHESHADWEAVLHDLRAASLDVHATQLATLCQHAEAIMEHEVVSRMDTYLQIKDAYDALVTYMKKANLLMPDALIADNIVEYPGDT